MGKCCVFPLRRFYEKVSCFRASSKGQNNQRKYWNYYSTRTSTDLLCFTYVLFLDPNKTIKYDVFDKFLKYLRLIL